MSFFRQFSAAVYRIAQNIYTQTTNIQTVVNNIEGMLSFQRVGDLYFVDPTGGSDVTGDGSLANPWQTIDYAVGQTTTNHNDYIIGFDTGTLGFDEDANVGGVIVDKNAVHIMAVDYPYIENSNAGATSVFYVSGIKVEISGFYCLESTVTVEGIYVNPAAGYLYDINIHNNIFSGSMENAIHFNGVVASKIYNNTIISPFDDGIELTGTNAENIEIYHNHIIGASDHGISLNTAGCNRCWAHHNTIDGNNAITDIGIRINDAAAANNVIEHNIIFDCATSPTSDIGLRNYWHNPGNEQSGSFDILVADSTNETTKLDNIDSMITGEVEITFDISALLAVTEGTQIYFYAYTKRDGTNFIPAGWCSFDVTTDKIHPSIKIKVRPGDSELRIRSQLVSAVTLTRSVRYEIFWG